MWFSKMRQAWLTKGCIQTVNSSNLPDIQQAAGYDQNFTLNVGGPPNETKNPAD